MCLNGGLTACTVHRHARLHLASRLHLALALIVCPRPRRALRLQVVWNTCMREELLALLASQRSGAPSLPALLAFSFEALAGELVVARVFVRVFIETPAPRSVTDPAALCKGLVTHVFHAQQAQQAGVQAQSARARGEEGEVERQHLRQALRALDLLLESAPRLLGLLATKSAVDPLLSAIKVRVCGVGGRGGG
jgi:hypothetical protein